MAVKKIFVDGTLTTGSNNGTSWENAYQGAVGLQTAFDSVDHTVGHNYVLLRNKFTLTDRVDFDVWLGGMYNNIWARVIGCKNTDEGVNYTLLPVGQYVEIDASGLVNKDAIRYYTGGQCISFENLWIHSVNSTGYAAFAGNGIVSQSRYNYVFRNIKITGCYYALRSGLSSTDERIYRVAFLDCIFTNLTSHVYYINCSNSIALVQNCYIEIPSGCVFAYPATYNATFDSAYCMFNNIFVGGAGIIRGRQGAVVETVWANNSFYNQTDNIFLGQYVAGGAAFLSFYNNIIWLADPSKAILKTATGDNGGTIWLCDYNATNSIHVNRWGVNTIAGDNNVQLSNCPFADPANGNFNVNSPVLLGGGMPDYVGNASQIGAIEHKYRFPVSARTANLGRLSIFR